MSALPLPAHRREELLNKLASIVTTAIEAQKLTDLETLGAHLDDLAEEVERTMYLAQTLEWPTP